MAVGDRCGPACMRQLAWVHALVPTQNPSYCVHATWHCAHMSIFMIELHSTDAYYNPNAVRKPTATSVPTLAYVDLCLLLYHGTSCFVWLLWGLINSLQSECGSLEMLSCPLASSKWLEWPYLLGWWLADMERWWQFCANSPDNQSAHAWSQTCQG